MFVASSYMFLLRRLSIRGNILGQWVPATTETLKIDKRNKSVKSMADSVKPYDRHVIICVPNASLSSWEPDIDRMTSVFPYSLVKNIEDVKKAAKSENGENKGLKLKITAMLDDENSTSVEDDLKENIAQVLVYPDNLLFKVEKSKAEEFAHYIGQPVSLHGKRDPSFPAVEPAFKKLLLVCVHNARDKRCGHNGPLIIKELKQLLAERSGNDNNNSSSSSSNNSLSKTVRPSEVAVRGSSHIGGHAFAGVLISYPEGRWYGKICADCASCSENNNNSSRATTTGAHEEQKKEGGEGNVKELLDHVLKGTVYEEHLRGTTSSHVLQW